MEAQNQSDWLDMQQKFCKEYVIDFNPAQAALRAGYEEKDLPLGADYMLTLPGVRQYIRQLLADRSRKFEITAESVLREIAWIAFARTDDFNVETAGCPAPEDAHKASGPAGCSVSHKDEKTGRKVVYHFNLRIKLQALTVLCRHLGLFPKAGETMPPPFPNFIFPKKGML